MSNKCDNNLSFVLQLRDVNMEKNAVMTPETHPDELVEALKVVCDIIIGPELRLTREYVTSTNESLSLDHANLGQKVESALATIREDAMAISADLRKTKLDMEAERKKWHEELREISNQHQDSLDNLSKKINSTENTLATNVTKLRENMKTNLVNITQEHTRRFTAIEYRLAQCEEKSSALKDENMRLMRRLNSAAQSLVTGEPDGSHAQPSSQKQVDNLLNDMEESRPASATKTVENVPCPGVSNDATSNKTETEFDHSSKNESLDIDTVLNEV